MGFSFRINPTVKARTSKLRYGCEVQSVVTSAINYMTPARFTVYAEEWGFNTIQFQDMFWCHIERDYYQPQVYQQASLDKYHTMIDRAHVEGLEVILAFFVDFDDGYYEPESSRSCWDGWASHEYMVYGEGYVNKDWNYGDQSCPDEKFTWATGGRERYGQFIEDMAEEFNDCIIIPNKFPWHSAGAVNADYDEWSEEAFPYYLSRIRNSSNTKPVVFVPVHQDSNDWTHQDSWYDDPYGVILGLGHTIPWALDGGHSRDTFTGDDET